MTAVVELACTRCGRRFEPADGVDRCPDHEDVEGVLDVRYDDGVERATLDRVASEGFDSLWAFEDALPTAGERVDLGAGGTPLFDAPTLGEAADVSLWLKDETGNPSGSIKDRASAVLASRGCAADTPLACASTGNAAASLAAYAARAGLDCHIFVPAAVPEGKAVQPRVHGATVTTVDGGYDAAFRRCREACEANDWLDCSAAMNPYGLEGLRTVGFELALQAPADGLDWVVVPMGNGCGLAATWKGLATAVRHDVLDAMPRLLGVQAEGASAIHERFTGEAGQTSGTAADSIDVDVPHNGARACDALERCDGRSVVVDDDAILEAAASLARREGRFVEPASAATLAGLGAARDAGYVADGANVALLLTGTGLKDTESGRRVIERYR